MYSKEFFTRLYRTMYTIRVFETRCVKLYRQGAIRGYLHSYVGEEAIATGACAAARPQDYITSTHRGHGHCIARGGDLKRMVAEITGREPGYCKGRGGSMHIADLSTGNLGANGIVGGGIPIGVGAAMGAWIRGDDRVAIVFASDGAANNGVFGESLNFAASLRLPFILVLENNQFAVSTPIEQSTAEPELFRRGLGYGIHSERVDGNNVLVVYERTAEAIEACRRGEGPILLEAVTYRQAGHHVNDPGQYMPKDRLEYYLSRDPLKIGKDLALSKGGLKEHALQRVEAEVEREMDEAVEFALNSPEPSVEEFLREVEIY
ncbi:MAG TPA: thiamine pyrophosphate-dependent dehydrogenase E1 component subunit alpha [Acidobacteriota bacterium]|nr:thiamine pyrophosphate-dependent dehydrogenase E1 component subunit alpha [Acidobacteriota bacterium]